jgi:tRNA(Met) cytidine acetyltransferase
MGIAYESIQAKQVKYHLGSEVNRLVWNGFSGLNPDALGAASGLIKGGGLLFLIMPNLTTLSTHPDPDYLRMCRHSSELPSFGTRFLQRMIHLIETDHEVTLFRQGADNSLPQTAPINKIDTTDIKDSAVSKLVPKLSTSNSLGASGQLTADQDKMVECIKTVAKGHRKRPLVVMADRGRGKTSALGFAAARLTIEHALKVIITAPNKRACNAAFQHYQQEIDACGLEDSSAFKFYAPDTLLEKLPECQLLFVDEAASIPAPMLKQMLAAYPRIVFSSTTHGYEGTGQGFNVRFRQTLDAVTPEWKSFTLHQPVRWADADPLERWIFEFLVLNAQIPQLPPIDLINIDALPVAWVLQDTLYNNAPLLKQVTALLVTAHYQTSPSDIRMILDDPKITVGLIHANTTVVAVVLLLQEGGIDDPELAKNIIFGTRRPKGHLVPQALTSSTANPAFLSYQTYRVMRIAVHPEVGRHGLGSRLIGAAAQLGQKNKIDYLSASFGFTPLLNDFWGKNNFHLLRIGYHKDAASGAQSAIMVHTLNADIQQNTIRLAQEQCRQHFIFGLNTIYRTLDVDTTLGVLQSLALSIKTQSNHEIEIIYAFAHHHRSFEDCAHLLFVFILNCFAMNLIQTLSSEEQHLVCLRILKGESIAHCTKPLNILGKKKLDTTLKTAISKLLSATIQVEI